MDVFARNLDSINRALRNLSFEELSSNTKIFQPIFIIGLPRCGSALLHQCIAQCTDIGYVSNIAGKFYANIAAGWILQKQLSSNASLMSDFTSKFGNTSGPLEPCEFGWFWRPILAVNASDTVGDEINWTELERQFRNLGTVCHGPFIFDSPYINPIISSIAGFFDNAKFIYLKRDPLYVCNSIINARLSKYDDITKFYGAKPRDIGNLLEIKNPIEQVVSQVNALKVEIENGIYQMDDSRYLEINLEDLCTDTAVHIQSLSEFCDCAITNLKVPNLTVRNSYDYLNQTHLQALLKYFADYFG